MAFRPRRKRASLAKASSPERSAIQWRRALPASTSPYFEVNNGQVVDILCLKPPGRVVALEVAEESGLGLMLAFLLVGA